MKGLEAIDMVYVEAENRIEGGIRWRDSGSLLIEGPW